MQEQSSASTYWFVGAAFNHNEDQTQRFIAEGIWQNDNTDRYLDLVKSMRPGDRIAIKAAYIRKKGFNFETHGNFVSVMGIKATGTILENAGDGRNIKVAWIPVDPIREWYFYTYQRTVWKIVPGNWHNDALIAFTFDGQEQDIARFRNDAFWCQRFGDIDERNRKFIWTTFYEAVADGLRSFKEKRSELIERINDMASRVECMSYLHDMDATGLLVPLEDICPFTIMGIFNRGTTDQNRKEAARELAKILDVQVPVPTSFEGIPVLNQQKSMFFGYNRSRKLGDIDALWSLFDKALDFADMDDADTRSDFVEAYSDASNVHCVGWNLTMGLYWVRPWTFPTLDKQSQAYISGKLGIEIGRNGAKHRCSPDDYLAVLDLLKVRFLEDKYPVHSFPELSLAAWQYRKPEIVIDDSSIKNLADEDDSEEISDEQPKDPPERYTLDSVVVDGCFLTRARLESILQALKLKKNLIVQGPPGTGKTWLAKRLGYALIGEKDESRLRAVQFHPNLSYEDFVRGYRPTGQGKLELVDGPMMQMVEAASKKPNDPHVLVIEEINRGNPAQVFGEMLTLIEADKHTPDEALELSYPRTPGERVSVPENLYIIGTMNIADRSLALVDFALRRRFAFIELDVTFGEAWRSWVHSKISISETFLDDIARRMSDLNATIENDPNLKRQFKIGHSYLTPSNKNDIQDPVAWYRQVVETQIGPLLDEYWYDQLDMAREAKEKLLAGI